MQFRKNLLYSNICLILSTGAFLLQPTSTALAQNSASNSDQWSCRASADGGWECTENPAAARNSGTSGVVVSRGARRVARGETSAAAPSNALQSSAALDWVPVEQMSAEQRAQIQDNCCGAFIEPERRGVDGELVDSEAQAEGAATLFEAPGGISQSQNSSVTIDGIVAIQQGNRTVNNTETTYIDQEADTITLAGDVVFREPGVLLRGESAFVDQGNSVNRIERANYVLHQYGIHGAANVLIYDSEGEVLAIENGEFSRCEPGSEFWKLHARSMNLDTQAGIGTATSVTLRMKDVPVFHYPYTVPFPLGDQRMSGFLSPSIGSTSDGGFDYSQPYYLNLAPHYDATITPRIIADRGLMTSAEFRYLASWSMNTVSAALLPDDKRYDPATANVLGSDTAPRSKRWFVGLQHQGQLGDHWSTEVNYEAVSDDRYFRDLGSSGLTVTSRTYLRRLGQLNYRNSNWYAGTRVQRIDIIDPYISASDLNRPYDRMPELSLGNDYSIGGLQIGFDATHVRFDRDLDVTSLSATQLDNGALVTGSRAHIEPHISFPIRGAAGFFVPTAKYKYTSWDLDQQALGTENNPDRGVGVFSLDTGLVFEREMNRGNGFIQTLEPRLYYLYSEQQEQSYLPTFDTAQLNFSFGQLFRDDRFSGRDRVGDANQFSAAIGSRFLNSRGEEKARIAIGQIFYLEDRIVSLDSPVQSWVTLQPRDTDRSAIVSEGSYQFNDTWRFNADVQWNEFDQRIDEGSAGFRYQADDSHILNLAYRYRLLVNLYGPVPAGIDPKIKQTDVSGVWPLSNNWRLLGRWHYDHSNSRNLDTFAGVEYSNCCATIRLIGREWIDEDEFFLQQDETNTGVFFQLTLNGLGNISGGGISSLLSDGILGFKEYEANEQ